MFADVRNVRKMFGEKRVNSVAEFAGGYLCGAVKHVHHLSRMVFLIEFESKRCETLRVQNGEPRNKNLRGENRFYAVSQRVLDVGYLFVFEDDQ
jgi:hypothetical protein